MSNEPARRGVCLVVSAPSGAGKSSLLRSLLASESGVQLSVSLTTRAPRPGEQDGVDYHFTDRAGFDRMVAEGGMLEWATVFGRSYGTPRAAVLTALDAGRDVAFDIDWQGHRQLRASLPHDVVSVFVLPPSLHALQARLEGRGSDSSDEIGRRMESARAEISHWEEFDYVVVNHVLGRRGRDGALHSARRAERPLEASRAGGPGGGVRTELKRGGTRTGEQDTFRRASGNGRARGGHVEYTFHFGDVWAARDEFFWGTVLTLELSALSMVLSLVVAIFGALARTGGPRWLRWAVAAYVELIRNTPFLVQVFVIFFGLPALGIRLDTEIAAVIAMVLNGSAYSIEIVRAGIESIGHGQTEAARALGLHRLQSFRLIVLPQALKAVLPPLGSQFILLMLNSSILSVISADELTSAAQDIQSRTFRSFEAYIVAAAIYFTLSMLFSGVFSAIERFAFARPARS